MIVLRIILWIVAIEIVIEVIAGMSDGVGKKIRINKLCGIYG